VQESDPPASPELTTRLPSIKYALFILLIMLAGTRRQNQVMRNRGIAGRWRAGVSAKVLQSCSSDPFNLQPKQLQPDYVSSHLEP